MGKHIEDFTRVRMTEDERNEYIAEYGGGRFPSSFYRYACDSCGKRVWGSGLGIGSHRRACPGEDVGWYDVPVRVSDGTRRTYLVVGKSHWDAEQYVTSVGKVDYPGKTVKVGRGVKKDAA